MRHSEYSMEEPELIENKIKSSKLFIEQAMAIKQQAETVLHASLYEEIFLPHEYESFDPQSEVIIVSKSHFSKKAEHQTHPSESAENIEEHKFPQHDSKIANYKRRRTNTGS